VPLAQREASAARDGGTLNFGGGASQKPAPQPDDSGVLEPVTTEPAPAAPDRDAPAPSAGGHDETWWHSRSISHNERVEQAEAGIERCEAADDRRREASGLTPLGACDGAKAKLESAEQALDRFEEKARRDEVPASWLR
jgi:hypothetical protein